MGRITTTNVAMAIVTIVMVNICGETYMYFDAWTEESEGNLALMGVWPVLLHTTGEV